MTEYRRKKGNFIVKCALLSIIQDIMISSGVAKFVWLDEGFENDNQRIHFSSAGHKCMLVGVGAPMMSDTVLPLKVVTDWEGQPDQNVDVNLNISDIHIKTLEKIACEVYNTLRDPEVDDEWCLHRKEVVAGFLDTYMDS